MLKGQMQEGEVNGPGTIVGVNVALSGTLKDQNDIAIYGMVDGEVVSEKTVTVGQSAQVKGPIRGKVITVGGMVRGSIDATEKLEILETGKIFGSIATRDLVVRSGAQISGKVSMGAEEAPEVVEPPVEEEEPAIELVEEQVEVTKEDNEDSIELKPDKE